MTIYTLCIAVCLALATGPLWVWRRTLGRAREKAAADGVLQEMYGQYWMEVKALAQRRMLNAPSDEEWLADIRARASVPGRLALRRSLAAEASASVSSMRSALIGVIRQWMGWRRRGRHRPGYRHVIPGTGLSVSLAAAISAVAAFGAIGLAAGAGAFEDTGPNGVTWPRPIITISPTVQRPPGAAILVGTELLFTPKSAAIPPISVDYLRLIAAALRSEHLAVTLAGYAADGGTPAYNRALSWRRAIAVRDQLIALGVPSGQITKVIGGGSADHPSCRTKDQLGTRACADLRRVVITVSPEKGSP